MADTKGANISRMVLKQAGRAKEKVGWREQEDISETWYLRLRHLEGARIDVA